MDHSRQQIAIGCGWDRDKEIAGDELAAVCDAGRPQASARDLERRPYDERPRYEYHLTGKGAELVDLLMVMVAWGDKWLAGKAGPPVLYRHHACGEIGSVELRCTHCGEQMHAGDVEVLPGPGAAA
jgi:hypothetical protein